MDQPSEPTQSASQPSSSFGKRRLRVTRRSVRFMDAATKSIITMSGMGTVLAVLTVAAFLITSALPLFLPAKVSEVESFEAPEHEEAEPLHVGVDELNRLSYVLWTDGSIDLINLESGEVLHRYKLSDEIDLEGHEISAWGVEPASWSISAPYAAEDGAQVPGTTVEDNDSIYVVLGYDDGSYQVGTIGFRSSFFVEGEEPEDFRGLERGQTSREFETDRGVGIATREVSGQIRVQTLRIVFGDLNEGVPAGGALASGTKPITDESITQIALTPTTRGRAIGVVTESGKLVLRQTSMPRDESGRPTGRVTARDRVMTESLAEDVPDYLKVHSSGANILVGYEDGRVVRYGQYDTVQSERAFSDESVTMTQMTLLAGGRTLLCAGSDGRIATWFMVNPEKVSTGNEVVGQTESWLVERRELAGRFEEFFNKPDPASLRPDLRDRADSLLVLPYPDGQIMVRSSSLPGNGDPVTAVGVALSTRSVAVGDEAGGVRLMHITTGAQLGATQTPRGDAVQALSVAPRGDALSAVAGGQVLDWEIENKHPEVTASSMIFPLIYESQTRPEHIWQSSAGEGGAEPKFGIFPLVLGTLKATIYSMMFAVPLAILAAIYTSEFLPPQAKSKIKPVVEMMASLPSVVLGFLAGLVFAQFVGKRLASVGAVAFCIPIVALLSAYLWQLMPRRTQITMDTLGTSSDRGDGSPFMQWLGRTVRASGGVRLLALFFVIFAGVMLARVVGPLAERMLFAGDLEAWLSWSPDKPLSQRKYADPFGGWFIFFLPLGILVTYVIVSRLVTPFQRRYTAAWSGKSVVLFDLGKFLLSFLGLLVVTAVLAQLVSKIGGDPRGPSESLRVLGVNVAPMGTYIGRNALIVGFAMGFAVIPIIYTISEDALSAVPAHLRSASLGAGATPWQTATRVIMPVATSGLFSACMIGLGRAVGETMIVLMAAGNTPVMELNIFNGFRTLSANIAVELPESAKGSTHARTLFVCALVLFMMTFVINTVAESVRIRFRRKNANL